MKTTPPIKIFALGGLGEVGKNMYGIQYENEIILVDCGIKFPDEELRGIDYVIPDFTFLEKNKDLIKGLFITHGHEDHIGSIPFLLKRLNVPIYGGNLSIGFIKSKLEEHHLLRNAILKPVDEDSRIEFKNFSVRFLKTSHSIPDSFAVCVSTPYGNIVQTGDFKFDLTPRGGDYDIGKIAEIGNEGVFCLMSDSTNSEIPGFSLSESAVRETLFDIVNQIEGRIIFATFASNIYRLQQAIEASIAFGRRVAVFGRSMERSIRIGRELGYIQAPDDTFIAGHELNKYPARKITILCTGSQGEPMAALGRIAKGLHRQIQVIPGDTVIFSSSPIPGNATKIYKLIDQLERIGANVIHSKMSDIHTSGHGTQDEQKLMIRLLKPEYFVPIHGEYRMLVNHVKLAVDCGVEPEKTFVLDNGEILELDKDGGQVTGSFPANPVYVDGTGIGDIGNIVLRDRRLLSLYGTVIVTITIDSKNGELLSGPALVSRGFVYMKESGELLSEAERLIEKEVRMMLSDGITKWSDLKKKISDLLTSYFFEETKRSPIILPIIMEV
ncbi:ribonuclease J1 [Pseudalkalibacillus salsuginis]|uniref:ribonuclease J1 n=1 Tax=Pseudalkalibacillus salsuginis TaxID=2910972 RepID=UPI001F16221F|nr:ribonuclease J [Pseudalkalibacillus salsuginis]MCF6409549.1 ribonuclease J [Pseudalkalibacillus salsuginis]